MKVHDIFSPFLIIGILMGSTPPVVIYLAIHNSYHATVANQNAINARHKRNADIAQDENLRNERYLIEGLPDTVLAPIPNINGMQRLPHPVRKSYVDNTQHSNVEHERTAMHPVNIEDSLRDLDLRRDLYVAVLSSQHDVEAKSSAIMMTWASTISQVHFHYPAGLSEHNGDKKNENARFIPIKGLANEQTHAPQHVLSTLESMCNSVNDNYNWYLLTVDNIYVHTMSLLHKLQTMLPSENYIFGKAGINGQCEVDPALILSNTAFRRYCTGARGEGDTEPDVISHIENASRATCSASNQIFSTTGQSTFEENMLTPNSILLRHLETMDQEIIATKERISALHKSISVSPTTKASYMATSDVILAQGSVKLKNLVDYNDTRPSHSAINSKGIKLKYNCNLGKCKETQAIGYAEAKKLSDATYSKTANKTVPIEFSFSHVQSDVERSIEFYYIEQDGKGSDKVTQIVIEQEMGGFDVVNTKVQNPQAITVVTFVEDATLSEIEAFLLMVQNACEDLKSLHIACEKTLLYGYQSNGLLHLLRKYGRTTGAELVPLSNPNQPFALQGIDKGLLLFVSATSNFNLEFVKRCQINTKLKEFAYFPIAMHQRNDAANIVWDSSNFDTLCIDAEDLELEYNYQNLTQLYQHLIKRPDFVISRFVDPGLKTNTQR